MKRIKENLKIENQEELMNGIDPNSHEIMPPKVKSCIIGRIWLVVKAWWLRYSMRRYSRYMAKVIKELTRRSKEEVQIMEYKGKMYICYKGIPIVSEESLGCPWGEVIRDSRAVYQDWLSERELEK